MPYMTYNLPLQRTGFRPYGTTNPWQATQLSGLGMRQVFSEAGGRRLLGQIQRGFSPMTLGYMGQVCDPTDPLGDCYDPTVDATAPANACAGPNPPLMCSGSDFSYPSTTSTSTSTSTPGTPAAGTIALSPGSSPRVNVPLINFQPSSPVASSCQAGFALNSAGQCVAVASPCPGGQTLNSAGQCAASVSSSLSAMLTAQTIPGVPNMMILVVLGLALVFKKK